MTVPTQTAGAVTQRWMEFRRGDRGPAPGKAGEGVPATREACIFTPSVLPEWKLSG